MNPDMPASATPSGTPPPLPPSPSTRVVRPGGSASRRRRKKEGGSIAAGRGWTLGIFFALRIIDVAIYLCLGLVAAGLKWNAFHIFVFASGIWTTALLAGIWLRQSWARYILMAIMPLLFLAQMFLLPDVGLLIGESIINPIFVLSSVIYALIFIALLAVKSIARLTTQNYI